MRFLFFGTKINITQQPILKSNVRRYINYDRTGGGDNHVRNEEPSSETVNLIKDFNVVFYQSGILK